FHVTGVQTCALPILTGAATSMANVILKPEWQSPERDVTPELVCRNRRKFIKQLGLGAVAISSIGCAVDSNGRARPDGPLDTIPEIGRASCRERWEAS